MATAIRRNGTFEFKDVRYRVNQGSDRPERDGSRYIERIDRDFAGDVTVVADGFGYMIEVRGLIATAEREDWDDLDTLAATEAENTRVHSS